VHTTIGVSAAQPFVLRNKFPAFFEVGPQRSRIFHRDSKPLEGMEQINES
jgi:hypothetical protein